MLITAIVNNRGNTLVVELPHNRMDLETKMYSIGDELSQEVHITDSPDLEIRAKLSADSEIGLHLINLFNDKHALKDVNDVCQTVINAPDEVKEAIESDILNDQYSTPDELIEDVKKQTYEAGQYMETFYFPLTGMLEDEEYYDEYEVGNPFLMDYKWDISELVEKEQNADLGDMKDYFYDDDNAQAKMVTARWGIAEKNGKLYGKVDIKLREPFTAEEKEKVRDWVSGQNSDGFGEGLEQRPIETEDGDLYVSMWGADNYFIYDENEMNEYLSQQQSGGMKL
ncbi:hypothetical protein [Ruminococcus sp.]|uniref:hypothetical protein n=1 Tax=Ruminococcus sp. TaxID=41978 RepID=UPI00388D06D1